jgi:hypothetical protein
VWLLFLLAGFGPDPSPRPDFAADPKPYVALMLAGLAMGILGHLFRSRLMVAVGVLAVFAGTVVLPAIVFWQES